jgi:hypothetical protein
VLDGYTLPMPASQPGSSEVAMNTPEMKLSGDGQGGEHADQGAPGDDRAVGPGRWEPWTLSTRCREREPDGMSVNFLHPRPGVAPEFVKEIEDELSHWRAGNGEKAAMRRELAQGAAQEADLGGPQ